MTRPLRLRRLALKDLDHQSIYFDDCREGLGARFQFSARRTFERIARQPRWNPLYGFKAARLAEVRACQIESFPNLLVFYRITSEATEILRILHSARNITDLEDEILPD